MVALYRADKTQLLELAADPAALEELSGISKLLQGAASYPEASDGGKEGFDEEGVDDW